MVHVYTCIYIYIHAYVYIYIYLFIYLFMYIHMYIRFGILGPLEERGRAPDALLPEHLEHLAHLERLPPQPLGFRSTVIYGAPLRGSGVPFKGSGVRCELI